MMKKYQVCIIAGTMAVGCILGFSTIDGKVNEFDAKNYVGNIYEELPKELEQSGIEVTLGKDDEIAQLLISRKDYVVDHIKVGDEIEKIYKVYPAEWVNTRDHTIQVSYGKESHYGITTDYITYVTGEKNKIQSIIIGKTASFIDEPLPSSNQEAKKLLEGKWQSEQNRIVEFSEEEMKDSYMDELWEKQTYTVLTPNKILICREKKNQTEKLKLNFWLVDSKLYLFAINDKGMPIQESIEVFSKQ